MSEPSRAEDGRGGLVGLPVRLHLVDVRPALVDAWREAFRPSPEVSTAEADILAVARNAVVSPANSHGFMDGGVDAAYRCFFGPGVERDARRAAGARPEGHLPVGAATVVRTHHARIPFLILAPTMEMPGQAPPAHAYRAMRAVLRCAAAERGVGADVFCPGLATGVGGVPPELAAAEMAEAYGDWRAALDAGRA